MTYENLFFTLIVLPFLICGVSFAITLSIAVWNYMFRTEVPMFSLINFLSEKISYTGSDGNKWPFAWILMVSAAIASAAASQIMYDSGTIKNTISPWVLVVLAPFVVRFVADISRSLKYNRKTGEAVRIKELEEAIARLESDK